MQTHEAIKKSGYHTVEAPLEKIPAYYRAGSIVPRRERVRRSSRSMKLDPFTLIIPLTKEVSHDVLHICLSNVIGIRVLHKVYSIMMMVKAMIIKMALISTPYSSMKMDHCVVKTCTRLQKRQQRSNMPSPCHNYDSNVLSFSVLPNNQCK